MSSFDWDKEQWWEKYCLHGDCTREKCVIFKDGKNICPLAVKTVEMAFGSKIGKKLETDPSYLPMITRQSKMEHEFSVKFGKIELVGFADSFCDKTFRKLEEYKTGKTGPNQWSQKKADEHGQITMYLLMNWIARKIRPEEVECCIHWMPTQQNGDFTISFVKPIQKNIKHFKTKRTMKDIREFGARINKTWKEMEEYAKNHPPYILP